MKRRSIIIAIGVVAAAVLLQTSLAKTSTVPNEFDINNYTWLAGHWTGDGFGGTSEEVWTMPENGVMMGMYRHHGADGKLVFYEFLTLDKEGMRLKHFNPDMTGWETKEKFVSFAFVEATPDKLTFKGLVFERKSDTEMEISLRLNRSGKIETEVFHMKRASSLIK